jgi:hypothetical protein
VKQKEWMQERLEFVQQQLDGAILDKTLKKLSSLPEKSLQSEN